MPPTKFTTLLYSILSKIELGALAITVIGMALFSNGQAIGRNLLILGITSLACVFFLTAFMIPPSNAESVLAGNEQKKGFLDMIGSVLWKLMHISCAVTAIGIMFYTLHFLGFGQLLLIGTGALTISVAFSAIIILQKAENIDMLKSGLMRAVPLGLLGGYILYMNWPVTL